MRETHHRRDGQDPNYSADPQLQPADVAERSPDAPHGVPRFLAASRLDDDHGVFHGAWIDASQTDAAIAADVRAMLERSPTAARNGVRAKDWMLSGSRGFAGHHFDGRTSLPRLGTIGRGIARHGPAFSAYASLTDGSEQLNGFEDHYLGTWASLDAYAASFVDDAGYNRLLDENLPETIRGYVRLDTAAIARDMTSSGAVELSPLPDGQVAIFARQ